MSVLRRLKIKNILLALVILVLLIWGLVFLISKAAGIFKGKTSGYSASELHIDVLVSENDKDGDGVDDYTDIMLGARAYIETNPEYKSEYYAGGYPDGKYGVCTDVIWQAFKAAGYDLKNLIDEDIKNNMNEYPDIEVRDPNIDFRRVNNLNVFFKRKAQSLTTDLNQPGEWQPGDIVVFDNHIAICSDKRNADGVPFIIHLYGGGGAEADSMSNYNVTAHYRWNG